MTTSLEARLQFFADQMAAMIQAEENLLLSGVESQKQERIAMLKSEIYQELLEKFEELFVDIICKE